MLKNEDKISPISQTATVWVELFGIRRCVTLVYIQDIEDNQLIVAASVKHPLDNFSRPEAAKLPMHDLFDIYFGDIMHLTHHSLGCVPHP